MPEIVSQSSRGLGLIGFNLGQFTNVSSGLQNCKNRNNKPEPFDVSTYP